MESSDKSEHKLELLSLRLVYFILFGYIFIKIIEMQEQNAQKKNAGFFWENPSCQSIYDHNEGKIYYLSRV